MAGGIPATVACLSVGVLTLLAQSCTLGTEVFVVDIRNDTGQPVELARCTDGPECNDVWWRDQLSPGETSPVPMSNGGSVAWVRLFDGRHETIGCIRLEFHSRQDDLEVPVSASTDCSD